MKKGSKSKKKNSPPAKVSPTEIQKQTVAFYEGPLPTPQTLDQYNTIVNGAAERINKLAKV